MKRAVAPGSRPGRRRVGVLGVAFVGIVLAACGSEATEPSVSTTSPGSVTSPATTPVSVSPQSSTTVTEVPNECAHVIAVDVSGDASAYTFSVTVSSTETGWDKYADAWVVKSSSGEVYGERILAHPHVEEQPFTRSLSGVTVPDGVTRVVVAARDSVLGFCGDEFTVDLE